MAKTYIVAPNYTTRPPPSDHKPASGTVPATGSNVRPGTTDSDPAVGSELSADDVSSSGALFLGDIIRNPLGPELVPLNRVDRIKIPSADLVLPVDIKKNFKATRKALLSGRFGIWVTLLATLGLPLGVEIGLFLERNSEDVISVSELETLEFIATDDFVNKSMKLKSIEAYLEGCRDPPPPLYMVTGLKIVRGASAKSEATAKAEASFGANVPVADVKNILEFTKSRTAGESFDGSTPFVLAFRARKILYKKGKFEHTLFLKGASMMDGSHVIKESEVEVNGLGEDVILDETLLEDDEIHVQKDDEDDIEWIVSNSDW
jgi:hypothetical protein